VSEGAKLQAIGDLKLELPVMDAGLGLESQNLLEAE